MHLLRREIAVTGSPIAEAAGKVVKWESFCLWWGNRMERVMAADPSETRTIQGRHYPSTLL
jgi:hypothetical protein